MGRASGTVAGAGTAGQPRPAERRRAPSGEPHTQHTREEEDESGGRQDLGAIWTESVFCS